MNMQSRRQFLRTCWYALLAGSCSGICPLVEGCERGTRKTHSPERRVHPASGRRTAASSANIDPDFIPAYVKLWKRGELKEKGEKLWRMMERCTLCPRRCGVNRLKGEAGFCRASSQLEVSAYHAHFGEERPLVGSGGSGTVFFTHCGLRCVFCINWEISQESDEAPIRVEDLSQMMLMLQERGCHNINVVTPTHYSPHIVLALDTAAGQGLRLPIVYNTCGWERLEILRLLDGIVDIYLPDFKYAETEMAVKYSSGAGTYPEITKAALLEMHRQVGVAKPAQDGLMYRGLMIRHLVMPNGVSGFKNVVAWISENLPKDTYLNIMSQYTPVYKASRYPEIDRKITLKEYRDAVQWAQDAGLTNLDIQGYRY